MAFQLNKDQCVGCGLRGHARYGKLLDLLVGNHARKSVRAKDDAVAGRDVKGKVVGIHIGIGSQRAGDDGP